MFIKILPKSNCKSEPTPILVNFSRSLDQDNQITIKRNCFLGKMSSLLSDFNMMSAQNKLLPILCPKNSEIAVCVSKYLGILSEKKLDLGLSDNMLGRYAAKHSVKPYPYY